MYTLSNISMVRSERTILTIDALNIPTDQFTVILGHNGSGKSTLVNLLAGQLRPDTGSLQLENKDLASFSTRELAQSVAYLPQKLPPSVGLTVRELIRLGRFPWRGTFGRWNSDDERIIEEAMTHTGIMQYANIQADQLSGGERQRAWVSMLLAQQSPILILDEPTSALDVHHQYQLMNLLAELNSCTNRGIIVILHDLNLALQYASHVLALKGGRIAFEGSVDLLLNEKTLSELYHSHIQLIDHPSPISGASTTKVAVVCA